MATDDKNKAADAISSVLSEKRKFPPPAAFSEKARIGSMEEYEALYKAAEADPESYWAGLAEEFHWFKKWDTVLEWETPYAKWFNGGTTNICYNAVDVHAQSWRRNKAAIIWEGEEGEQRVLTYGELHRQVSKFANVLKIAGIRPGDRVAIYMGMVPELVIAVLACARVGAVHNVIFAGFSAHAITERVNDSRAKLIICCDGTRRRGSSINLKNIVDEAIVNTPSVRSVIVLKVTGEDISMHDGMDHWWHDLMGLASDESEPVEVESEHPLFVLYTSGSTGKPKGILHTTAGYMVHAASSFRYVFDIRDDDIYWCTADVGWITGHSYMVYGPPAQRRNPAHV